MTPAVDTPALLAGRRVLIVEDRFIIAQEIARQLKAWGAQIVGPAPSLDRGLDLADRQPIDLALLDVDLDGELVYPLAEILKQRGTPIVFLTGYDDALLPPEWASFPCLQKPVSRAALRQELQRLS